MIYAKGAIMKSSKFSKKRRYWFKKLDPCEKAWFNSLESAGFDDRCPLKSMAKCELIGYRYVNI